MREQMPGVGPPFQQQLVLNADRVQAIAPKAFWIESVLLIAAEMH